MTTGTEETSGTASLIVEREPWPFLRPQEFVIRYRRRWPKAGSTVLAPSFAEEVDVIVSVGGWSTNVAESPLFASQILAPAKRSTLWEKLARLRGMIPDEERRRYPADAARNIDRYLYGNSQAE